MAESGQSLESIARAAALKAARPSLLQNPSQTLQRHAVVAASLKEFVAKLRTATGERAPLQESRSRTPGAGGHEGDNDRRITVEKEHVQLHGIVQGKDICIHFIDIVIYCIENILLIYFKRQAYRYFSKVRHRIQVSMR